MYTSETAKVLDSIYVGCDKIKAIKALRNATANEASIGSNSLGLLPSKEVVDMILELKGVAKPSNFDELEFYHVLRDNVPILSEKEAKLILQIVKNFIA